ncbi:NAD(P)-dependent oxidoreductase [Embleya scabrispora]|uniref:NAD(P)-dependent oxidoreductase n=1 Tax=Embleya scabrispora TaxID=159449 RepID=UPI000361E435|nr:NAD(P)-dependent oxidoreductase [Embleya scabrispora]MYS83203.1 NAD-binding protein [Streptomyces sp. SID5474]
MRVAVCGLGRMGTAGAEALVAAGHEVTVWNRTPRTVAGTVQAASAAEAARDVDAVVLFVFDGPAAEAVLLGPNGIAAGAAPGTLVINATTLAPEQSRELAAAAHAAGLRYLEAPVLGSVPAVRAGTLIVLTAGEPADVAAAEPVLLAWSHAGERRHVGPVGAATALKLVANLGLGVAAAGLHDAVRLGAALGLARADVLDVLTASAIGGLVGRKRERLDQAAYADADFTVAALAKDLVLVGDVTGTPLPVARAAAEVATSAVRAGDATADISALGR